VRIIRYIRDFRTPLLTGMWRVLIFPFRDAEGRKGMSDRGTAAEAASADLSRFGYEQKLKRGFSL
jgi:hypothetical protein